MKVSDMSETTVASVADNNHFFIAESSAFIRKRIVSLYSKVQQVLPERDISLFDRAETTLTVVEHMSKESAKKDSPLVGNLKHAVALVDELCREIEVSGLSISDLRNILTVFQQIVGEYATRYDIDGGVISTGIWKR